jgi:uncharacterized membrane protein YoaK (UPF0700 family)
MRLAVASCSEQMTEAGGASGEIRRDRRMLSLAAAAGGVDAATYLGLGHAFPANMTGNTVLLVISVAHGGDADLLRAAIALAGFSAGVVGGTIVITVVPGPSGSRVALRLHAVMLAAILAVWALLGAHPAAVREALLGGAGVAMGLQAAVVRVADTAGVAATYVTGTLTHALARQTTRLIGSTSETASASHARRLAELDWLAYGLGALCGGLLAVHAPAESFALPALLAAVAAAG